MSLPWPGLRQLVAQYKAQLLNPMTRRQHQCVRQHEHEGLTKADTQPMSWSRHAATQPAESSVSKAPPHVMSFPGNRALKGFVGANPLSETQEKESKGRKKPQLRTPVDS